MKTIFTIFILIITICGYSQSDVKIISSNFVPSVINEGEKSTLLIEFLIDGNSEIVEAGSIEIQLSFPYKYYTTKVFDRPMNFDADKFIWSLNENNYWSGINRGPLNSNQLYKFEAHVFGVNETNKPESSDFHIREIKEVEKYFGSSKENDYSQAYLEVISSNDQLKIVSLTPMDDFNNVPTNTNLKIVFNQNVLLNSEISDFVYLINASTNNIAQIIDLSADYVTFNNDMIEINISPLSYNTIYYLLIPYNLIHDTNGNIFKGIHDQQSWSFTTGPNPSLITCIQESFETNTGYELTSSFDNGSYSFFDRYSIPDFENEARNDVIIGWEGEYGILGQNFTETGNDATQSITLNDLDISELLTPSVSISLAALDSEPQFKTYEGGDGIQIFARIDDQVSIILLGEFAPNALGEGDLYLDTNGDGVGDGEKLTRELKTFTFSDGLTSGTTLDLIIALTSNDDFELLAVDNIRVHRGNVDDCEFIQPSYDELAIYTIQGDAPVADYLGEIVTTTGTISGDFQGSSRLAGFFMQDQIGDGDTQSSDGIFVHLPPENVLSSTNLYKGDQVRVTGVVTEKLELTTLDYILDLEIINVGNSINPLDITLPETTNGELEQYEGMLVHIDNPMTVSQNYFHGRYGQLTLSSPNDEGNEGRLYQPTNQFLPNSQDAIEMADENMRRILILDDGQDDNPYGDNPFPVPFIDEVTQNVIRSGDHVDNLVGVLDQGRINSNISNPGIEYRLHPVEEPLFTSINSRENTPVINEGNLKVASFNVLNYFNGDGQGGGFPTARGADSESEFQRQTAKIVEAILEMDADIFGLIELENDGYDENSAIQELVTEINDAFGSSVYQFIDPGGPIGNDAIAVGIIYKPSKVTPVGNPAILDSSVNPLFDDQKNRPTLAQTFTENVSAESVTILVNHLKSKGSDCDSVGDPDTGDGQGNCNQTRTNAAIAMSEWIATDPTNSGDSDFLIIGDLNAYAKEDPITTLESNGFIKSTNLLGLEDQYTYVFDGEAGLLDHILSTPNLNSQIQDISIWHINTDEATLYDYDEDYNPDGFYSIDPFRSSDHDPIIISLNLTDCVDQLDITTNTNLLGEDINTEARFSIKSTSEVTGPGSLRYSAQNKIVIDNGFKVRPGTIFKMVIGGCQ